MEINWPLLVSQGRAKAFGIPWSDEERHAILDLNIPPDFVRCGCLTEEEYSKAKGTAGGKPFKYWKLPELRQEADRLGISYAEVTTRAELAELIGLKREANPSSGNAGTLPAEPDPK